jgi:hypothetical protein
VQKLTHHKGQVHILQSVLCSCDKRQEKWSYHGIASNRKYSHRWWWAQLSFFPGVFLSIVWARIPSTLKSYFKKLEHHIPSLSPQWLFIEHSEYNLKEKYLAIHSCVPNSHRCASIHTCAHAPLQPLGIVLSNAPSAPTPGHCWEQLLWVPSAAPSSWLGWLRSWGDFAMTREGDSAASGQTGRMDWNGPESSAHQAGSF